MKSVLISIQPKWVELIANGKKTVEVRKTKPKLETPFKCYIYCTKDNTFAEKTLRGFDDNGKAIYYKANKGKVIGEFVCDDIINIVYDVNEYYGVCQSQTQIPYNELHNYLNTCMGYGWHISDLVIYDKPRELKEFKHECNGICIDTKKKIKCKRFDEKIQRKDFVCDKLLPITRPFQSWGYVYEADT